MAAGDEKRDMNEPPPPEIDGQKSDADGSTPTVSDGWYYASEGEKHGPVEPEKLTSLLASGVIGRDALVWRHGMSDWIPLDQTEIWASVPEEESPPPLPPTYVSDKLNKGNKDGLTATQILNGAIWVGIILFFAYNYLPDLWPNSLERRISTGLERISESAKKANKLKANNLSISQIDYFRYVTGSITNTSDQKFSYLMVKLNLFDPNGRLIDSTAAYIQDLEPDQTWNFKAIILNNAVATARVTEIEGW